MYGGRNDSAHCVDLRGAVRPVLMRLTREGEETVIQDSLDEFAAKQRGWTEI